MSPSYQNRNNKYTSTNYVDVFKILVPNFYLEDDLDLSGTQIDPLNSVINSHIDFCNIAYSKELFGGIGGSPLSSFEYEISDDSLDGCMPLLLFTSLVV